MVAKREDRALSPLLRYEAYNNIYIYIYTYYRSVWKLMYAFVFGFGPNSGRTWPRDPFQRVRLEKRCKTQPKIAAEPNYTTISFQLCGPCLNLKCQICDWAKLYIYTYIIVFMYKRGPECDGPERTTTGDCRFLLRRPPGSLGGGCRVHGYM